MHTNICTFPLRMAQSQHESDSEQSLITDRLIEWTRGKNPVQHEVGIERYLKADMDEALQDDINKHIGTVRASVSFMTSRLISATDSMVVSKGGREQGSFQS